jgi:lactate 2-monooxygenase
VPSPGRERQREIYVAGLGGKHPAVPAGFERLEARAREAMSAEAWAYAAGGAGTESTVRENRAAFERWRIVPRVLRDVAQRDLSVEILGRRLPVPVLLAPIGVLELAHPEADLAVARAAAALGVPMIFSSQASIEMERCAAAMGESPRWFQLYWGSSDELVASFVRRAEACCCQAIVLTLDTTMLGWRTRDLDLAYLPFLRGRGVAQYLTDPVFRKLMAEPVDDEPLPRPPVNLATLGALAQLLRRGASRAAVQRFIAVYARPAITWERLRYLRGLTKRPILLKGILHPDDARGAVEHGMDGVVVSNHGGRQVDGAIASLDALPGVVDAVAGRIPVLFDSGVRGGADVFKALALGATAVCLGRPYLYGLALAGEAGVTEVVRNVVAELDITMALSGCRAIRDITKEMLASRAPSAPS